jgi:hypothetical protein
MVHEEINVMAYVALLRINWNSRTSVVLDADIVSK